MRLGDRGRPKGGLPGKSQCWGEGVRSTRSGEVGGDVLLEQSLISCEELGVGERISSSICVDALDVLAPVSALLGEEQ